MMKRILMVLALAIGPTGAFAQTPDANEILAGMRAALGGADKVAGVKALAASGTMQRVTPRGSTESDLELAIVLPDKYMTRMVVAGQGSMSVYRSAGFNGDALISEIDAPPNLAQNMRERLAGATDRPAGAAREPTAEEKAERLRRQVLAAKKDFARLALGLLGSSYEAFPLQFSYAGQAESGDGTAHVIEARGAEGFEARLFIDTKTKRALMLTWSEPGGGANAGTMIERRIYYSNFKPVGGLTLPHTFQRSVSGKPVEETTYAEITVNSKIDGKKFTPAK